MQAHKGCYPPRTAAIYDPSPAPFSVACLAMLSSQLPAVSDACLINASTNVQSHPNNSVPSRVFASRASFCVEDTLERRLSKKEPEGLTPCFGRAPDDVALD